MRVKADAGKVVMRNYLNLPKESMVVVNRRLHSLRTGWVSGVNERNRDSSPIDLNFLECSTR
jgi:hypothetical protein